VSGTSMRELLGSPNIDDSERGKLFKKVFGYYDKGVFSMITNKFKKLFGEITEEVVLNEGVKDKLKKVFKNIKKEMKQNKKLGKILTKYIRQGGKLSSSDTTFAKQQFLEALKLVGLTGLVLVPFGKFSIPVLVKVAEMVGMDLLPSSFKEEINESKKEFVIWGIAPGKSSEDILYTKAKSNSEAKKVIKVLTDKHGVKKARIQVLDLEQDPSSFWKSDKIFEGVDLPIEIGDTVMMGKFKNKKVVIKTIEWNEKGDLLINGKSAMRMRIPKKSNIFDEEVVKEFLSTIDINEIIEEASTVALSGLQAVDSGPNALMKGLGGYVGRNKEQAEQLGWEVIDYILDIDITNIPPNKKEFDNDRVSSVTYLPAGIGTGKTPNNQDNLIGVKGYNKWVKNMKKIAQEVGFKLIKFKKDEKEMKKQISKDTTQTLKQQKSDEKEQAKDIKDVKVEESTFSKDWWGEVLTDIECSDNPLDTRILLQCGGAYGHMAHPFDDKDLTFGDLKKIIELGLGGHLNREDNVTEKLDGQNLMISWKNNKLIVARNKGHIKDFGKTALSVSGIKSKFEGRGDIADAFGFAVTDLQKAIKGLSQKQKDKIFNEGQHWMNLEVMWPASANVIDYDVAEIVFHGTLKYDEKGNVIGEVKGSGRVLAGMIKQTNQHIQKKYTIGKPNFLTVSKHQDFGKMKKKYSSKLDKLRNQYGLKDSDTLSLYHQSYWQEYIYNAAKQMKYNISDKVLKGLTKRWAFFDKSYKISSIKKDIDNEQFLNWFLSTDKKDHKKMVKENMKPFEVLFFEVGAEIMKNMSGFIAANPDKAVQGIKKRIEKSISDVRSGKDLKKLNTLKLQLDKLDAIGGLNAIVPSEGIVFKYKGNTYKFTGAFAPINQLTGLMNF